MRLEGRGSVVTGGGRGIGAAIARTLAEAGAAVVVAARTQEQIVQVATDISDAGGEAWAVTCDVSDQESVQALARSAGERLGHVDILVNNAGIASSAPLQRLTLDEWNRLTSVNATGPFLCTQAFVPAMIERNWGRVVTIASMAALEGAKYISGYAASKHAVLGFTRSIAHEVEGSGVTVNAICPGYVDSEMTRETIERIMARTEMSRDEALNAILETAQQDRLIAPHEVAAKALWLCSDAANAVNGQAIVMDDGGSNV